MIHRIGLSRYGGSDLLQSYGLGIFLSVTSVADELHLSCCRGRIHDLAAGRQAAPPSELIGRRVGVTQESRKRFRYFSCQFVRKKLHLRERRGSEPRNAIPQSPAIAGKTQAGQSSQRQSISSIFESNSGNARLASRCTLIFLLVYDRPK